MFEGLCLEMCWKCLNHFWLVVTSCDGSNFAKIRLAVFCYVVTLLEGLELVTHDIIQTTPSCHALFFKVPLLFLWLLWIIKMHLHFKSYDLMSTHILCLQKPFPVYLLPVCVYLWLVCRLLEKRNLFITPHVCMYYWSATYHRQCTGMKRVQGTDHWYKSFNRLHHLYTLHAHTMA